MANTAPNPVLDADPGLKIAPESVAWICPCPENADLYRPVGPNDPDIQALAESIREYGLREPLTITEDGYILSGHRRWEAAKLVGLTTVPCRTEPMRYCDRTSDEIVRLLREHNRQRVKSLDEILREEVVMVDSELAYHRLLRHRIQKSNKSDWSQTTIDLTVKKCRKRISDNKREMLDAAIGAVEFLRKFWPTSDRHVHYVLLNDPPLRNSSRPRSRYANDRKSYHDLCDLLTRARLAGHIPWLAIADGTRTTTHGLCYANAQDFIGKELYGFFRGYGRDLQRTQPNHVEIVVEKFTVRNIVESVARRYGIPVTFSRGYCSITPRYEIAQRFQRSGKEKLIILLLSDFDPDGEAFVESFARSMRDDFNIDNLMPIKAALSAEQVADLELPPRMRAKTTSSQYKKFARRHGNDVFELEAISPEVLQRLLTEAIDSVIDLEALNAEMDAEREDAAFLETARQRACLALRGIQEGGAS